MANRGVASGRNRAPKGAIHFTPGALVKPNPLISRGFREQAIAIIPHHHGASLRGSIVPLGEISNWVIPRQGGRGAVEGPVHPGLAALVIVHQGVITGANHRNLLLLNPLLSRGLGNCGYNGGALSLGGIVRRDSNVSQGAIDGILQARENGLGEELVHGRPDIILGLFNHLVNDGPEAGQSVIGAPIEDLGIGFVVDVLDRGGGVVQDVGGVGDRGHVDADIGFAREGVGWVEKEGKKEKRERKKKKKKRRPRKRRRKKEEEEKVKQEINEKDEEEEE